mgnify:CR=1 FL=1
MNRFIKTGLAIITAMYISCGFVSAATPAELYDDVWKIVNKKFYDPTNNSQDWAKWRYRYEHKLKTVDDAYVAIDTMLASLNDPYTRFLQPKEFSEETQSIKGSLKGIGTQIGLRDGELVIIAPLEDSPAERAGLLADDKILEINGTGYRAQLQGNTLVVSAGYSHPVELPVPAGVKVELPKNTTVIISGIDKQVVGHTEYCLYDTVFLKSERMKRLVVTDSPCHNIFKVLDTENYQEPILIDDFIGNEIWC